ncbi:MAG: response regulator [Saprospiraceae bacterium]|nr:response regulator [Lewinella sp.]
MMLPAVLWSQQVGQVESEHIVEGRYDISHLTQVFVDKTAKMDLDEVRSLNRNAFQPLTSLELSGKYTRSKYAYWLHFHLPAQDSLQPLVLECGQHDKIDYYQLAGSSVLHRKAGYGNVIWYEGRLFPNKYSIKLAPAGPDGADIFVRITNDLSFTKPYALLMTEIHEFKTESSRLLPYYIFHAIFFTFLLFTALFTFIQFLLNKERAFLYYALTVLATLILYYKLFDLANPLIQLLPPFFGSYKYFTAFNFLPPIPGVLFVMSYFNTKEKFPLAHKIMHYSLISLVTFFFVDKVILFIDKDLAWRISDFCRVFFFLVMLFPIYIFLKSKAPMLRYIIIGFLITVICTIINMLVRMTQAWDVSKLWDLPLLIQFLGIITGYIFFWLGLAYRSRQILLERNTIRQNLEDERRENAYQEELNRMRNAFFTNITHEFRTPLTVISGLAKNLPQLTKEKMTDSAALIASNGRKMLNMVNQLLSIARLEAGKMPVHWQQSDFVQYSRFLLESFSSLVEAKNIQLFFSSGRQELFMDFDADKWQTMLNNLLANAIKFTPEGGQIKVTLLVQNDDEVIVQVSDSGIGISPEQLPFIFDRFYQTPGQGRDIGQGTGIGLTLVKELCRLLKWEIAANSTVGHGSTFEVHIPIHRQAPLLALKKDVMPIELPPFSQEGFADIRQPPINKKQASLLLVEDSPDVRYYLQQCLAEDYHIIEAADGNEGWQKAVEHLPDLIISDVMMPGKNGFELCETVKNDERTDHIPVILLTAKATQQDKNQGLYAGADAYVLKPFDKEELLIRVGKLLELRRKLLRQFLDTPNAPDAEEKSVNPLLERIDSILQERYADADFSTTDLYQTLHMGKSKFYEELKVACGLSPGLYVRAYRLRQAQHLLLKAPQLSVREVAYEVGFRSPVYFSQAFKQAFDCSANEFRLKNGRLENS